MAGPRGSAVVLGGDVEALAAAAVLAQRLSNVHLVDTGPTLGGLAAARELAPGHVVPGLLHDAGLARRKPLAGLELERHGLRWRERRPASYVRREDGPLLYLPSGPDDCSHLGPDAEPFRAWRGFLGRVQGVLEGALDEAPPTLEDPGVGDLFQLARRGWSLRSLGDATMVELLRIAPLPGWDWTHERFGSAALRAGLLAPVLAGTMLGPRAAGTALLLALREATVGPEPEGGPAALVRALERRCAELGVRVHGDAAVRALRVRDGAVCGVVLDDGTELEATRVVSALSPSRTLLELLPAGTLGRSVEHELEHWRARPSSAVLCLAFPERALLECDPVPPLGRGPERVVSATSPTALERAADALKYGILPEAPWLDVRLWPAESGGETLSVHVHGVPAELRDGWDEQARGTLRARVRAELGHIHPAWGREPLAEELLLPADLERLGAPEGHLCGGELALDQLWLQRPCLSLAGYATPLRGLFLAGSGSHPGGPFLGGAGVLGARAALAAR